MTYIKIDKAKENNLKDVSVDIPHNCIVAVSGPSGSGKSTLVQNILGRVGERRHRRLLGFTEFIYRATGPNVGYVEGLPTCIGIQQEPLIGQVRSTVGTYTKILDHLANLFLSYGTLVSNNGEAARPAAKAKLIDWAMEHYKGCQVEQVTVESYKTINSASQLPKDNFFYVITENGYWVRLTNKEVRSMLPGTFTIGFIKQVKDIDSIESAKTLFSSPIKESLWILDNKVLLDGYSHFIAMDEPLPYSPPSRRLFSFNSNYNGTGRCETCEGLGTVESISLETLIKDSKLPILKGGFNLNMKLDRFVSLGVTDQMIRGILWENSLCFESSWNELPAEIRDLILYGTGDKKCPEFRLGDKQPRSQKKPFIGLINLITQKAKSGTKVNEVFRQYLQQEKCSSCAGSRYNRSAKAMLYRGLRIGQVSTLSISELNEQLAHLKENTTDTELQQLETLTTLLKSFEQLSVGHLGVSRPTSTLSGGEAQRLRLALGLAVNVKNACYLIDEPSRSLHAADSAKIANLLPALKDRGNTVILVDHNPSLLSAADHNISLGPGGGSTGGKLVPFEQQNTSPIKLKNTDKDKPVKQSKKLRFKNLCANNLKNVDLILPLNAVTIVVGVSGSGKSSAILEELVPRVLAEPDNSELSFVDIVDQKLLTGNSRSIVATALSILDEVRQYYASTEQALALSLTSSDFSFNSTGACKTCQGIGFVEYQNVKQQICSRCNGSRFHSLPLMIKIDGLSIYDLLSLTISELIYLEHPAISPALMSSLETADSLGLGHLSLARSIPSLSPGERQRITLTHFFANDKKGENGLLILDEPTAGLSREDAAKIFPKLTDLVREKGHTLVVIEHNLDILPHADHIIEFGPVGGPDGGHIVFQGRYNSLKEANTQTALMLKKHSHKNQEEKNRKIQSNTKEVESWSSESWLRNSKSFESFVIEGQINDFTEAQNSIVPSVVFNPNVIPNNIAIYEMLDLFPRLLTFFSKALPKGCIKAKDISELKQLVGGATFGFSPVAIAKVEGLVAYSDFTSSIRNLKNIGFKDLYYNGEIISFAELPKQLSMDLIHNSWVICEETLSPNLRELAYQLSLGVVYLFDKKPRIITTRFISRDDVLKIGLPFNSKYIADQRASISFCKTCEGMGTLMAYQTDMIIANQNESFTIDSFWKPDILSAIKGLRRQLLAPEAKFYKQEGIANFLQPYSSMDEATRLMFEHGILQRSFLKPSAKRADRKQDYYQWAGIHNYVKSVIQRVSPDYARELKSKAESITCPACYGTGVGWESHYLVKNKTTLFQLLHEGTCRELTHILPSSDDSLKATVELNLGSLRLAEKFGDLSLHEKEKVWCSSVYINSLYGLTLVNISDENSGLVKKLLADKKLHLALPKTL